MQLKESINIPCKSVPLIPQPALEAAARLERLFPESGDSSVLTLSCHRSDYSASKIARAVEDTDAHLLNLNLTSETEAEGARVKVEVRVNRRNPEAVIRSLERYGFEVLTVTRKAEGDDSTIRSRYEELMHYLIL